VTLFYFVKDNLSKNKSFALFLPFAYSKVAGLRQHGRLVRTFALKFFLSEVLFNAEKLAFIHDFDSKLRNSHDLQGRYEGTIIF
jgi:hypothetical protein